MVKFRIERRDSDDYITNLEHYFTLLVIPPEKQPEGYELGRQVVGADFASLHDKIVLGIDDQGYDFESLEDAYFDDDSEHCNKEIWFETIEYYCQLVLDKTPQGYTAYNYDYDLSPENCSPECWNSLSEAFPAQPELLFETTMPYHQNRSKTIQLTGRTVQIKPVFETAEQALHDGVFIYKLFDFIMDFTYLPNWSRPKGYVSPNEMEDKDNPYYFGQLLFDTEGNWIYDGSELSINEQEQVAAAIINGKA
jgi:hypothetical protein